MNLTKISFHKATKLCLLIFGLTILFHAAIVAGIVLFDYAPTDFLWGGRMKTRDELLIFEILSLVVVIFCILVVLIRANMVNAPGLKKVSGVVLWILFVMFLLNTIGNILAKTTFEKLFAIVTLLLSIFCLRMALEPMDSNN